MPMGDLTPTHHPTVQAKALELRNAMADCILSDEAITLIALRVNTGTNHQTRSRVGDPRAQAYS